MPLPPNATSSAVESLSEIMAQEAQQAIHDGAQEIDMVINVGALENGQDDLVQQDIHAVVESCLAGGAICKVILEIALLTDDEKTRTCQAARQAEANFVKTSTGFSSGGATVEDIALMSQTVAGANMGVKASGGIRTYDDAKRMIAAEATRLGASAGVQIVNQSSGVASSEDSGSHYFDCRTSRMYVTTCGATC